jgi:hypothetical protein
MRAADRQGTLSAMPDTHLTHLTLELDAKANPVAGVVRDANGSGEPFVGWIALTRAIELALERAASPAPPRASRHAAPLS